MFNPASALGGNFLADDRVPATLMPALRSIFDEMVRRAPRFLGPVSYPMAGAVHQRRAATYPAWMAQRLRAAFDAMAPAEQGAVRGWLAEVGGEGVLALELPPVARAGLAAAHIGNFPSL
ncbi:MAG: hypothetical protein V4508_03450 [Pseudomonadota bacterium]